MSAVNASAATVVTAFVGMLRILVGGVWSQIDCALFAPRNPTIVVATGNTTLTAAQSTTVCSNAGASGTVVFTLPAATAGLNFTFIVEAAQALRLDPNGSETIALPSTGVQQAAGKYIANATIGSKIQIICITPGTWDQTYSSGTWTVEP